MALRPQQQKLDTYIKQIKSGSSINEIFLYWKPGSGKSLVPPICSQLIDSEDTKILWVVPRIALAIQGESDFRGSGHYDVKENDIRIATNAGDPFRGLCGAVTTYQTIIANPDFWIKVSEYYKLVLILDEYDSLTEKSSWMEPIEAMYKNSIFRIPMTGTIGRSDNKKISFVPYHENGEIDYSETNQKKWIVYDTEQALKDKSILPFDSILIDGKGSYRDIDGSERHFSKFNGDSKELKTAFKTNFAYSLFSISLTHWLNYRKDHPWSKFLVVSPDIEIANQYLSWFREKGLRFGIATSEDSLNARETIKRFKMDNSKYRSYDGLISVAMIYKGLNVPGCTHMAFLTIVRGLAWCDQALGRIQRNFLGKEKGFLFAPNDPGLRSILKFLACGAIESANIEEIEQNPESEGLEKVIRRDIEALNSEAFINGIAINELPEVLKMTNSELETNLRKKITKTINIYVYKKSLIVVDGKEKIIKTESMRHRKLAWARVMIEINSGRDKSGKLIRIPVKEMTLKELKNVNEFVNRMYGGINGKK